MTPPLPSGGSYNYSYFIKFIFKLSCRKINFLWVYSSMNSNTYTDSCNHTHNQATKQFHHSKKLRLQLPPPLTPNPWQPTDLFSITTVLSFQESYKRNYTVCNFLRLAFFTQQNNFEIHLSLCTGVYMNLNFY